jgi:hypothetical protein
MKTPGHLGRSVVLAAVTLLGPATAASAAPLLITLEGAYDHSLSASVLFSYTGLSNSSGRVDLTVTNTSSYWDPRLTALAFNLPGAVTGVTGFSSTRSGWQGNYDRNDIDTPGQFGLYDVAALTGPNFNGGSANAGIARGTTANFSFTLSGTGLLGLSEGSFLSLLSYDRPGGANEAEQYFIARFQRTGLLGLGSDVATPEGPPSEVPPTGVPEPTTLLLSGIGLLGLAAVRRRLQA